MNERYPDLLPCPFCGNTPQDWPDFLHPTGSGWRDDPIGENESIMRHYMSRSDPRGVHGTVWVLGCLDHEGGCGAEVTGDSREDAIAAWNRRPEKA